MNIINTKLKNNKFVLNCFIILSFTFLSFIGSLLLLKNGSPYIGLDTQFHLKRIMELKEAINHGHILIDFSFNNFHGSSVMTMYPYFSLLPAVFLSFIIHSPINLIYGLFIFNTLLCFIISFYSSKEYIHSYYGSYIFSIIYSLSNTFLLHNIITGDLGIVYTYIFLPLVIFSFIQIIHNKNKWVELSLGFDFILCSHIVNTLILGVFLIMWLTFNIHNKLNKNIIFNLLRSLVLILIISSAFWLPLIYFYSTNNINLPHTFQLSRIDIKTFMSGLYGSKSNYTIGFFPLISLFITPFFYKRFNNDIKQMYQLSLLIVLSTLFFPWKLITSYEIFKFLNQFQFTFRLLFIPQMLLTFIISLVIIKYIKPNLVKYFYILTLFITILLQLLGQYTTIKSFSINLTNLNISNYKNNIIYLNDLKHYNIQNDKQFKILIDNTYHYSDDDYIPKSAISMSRYVNRNFGFYNNHYKIKINHIGYNKFNFYTNDNINISKLSLPIYAYNKENLHVYLNDKPINSYVNESGLLTINDIQDNIKSNNELYIKSTPDLFKIIGTILSILGWLFILSILIKRNFID